MSNGVKAPGILNLDNISAWPTSRFGKFTTRKEPLKKTGLESSWVPQPAWT